MVQPYRFDDISRQFDQAYGRVNALRTNRAHMVAGNALRGGDYSGAADALYGAGDLVTGARVQGMGEQRQAAAAQAGKAREEEVLKFTGEMAGRLSAIADQAKDDPSAIVGAFDTFFAPRLQELGEAPEEVAQVRQQLAADPRRTLLALGAGAAKAQNLEIRNAGEEVLVLDPRTGGIVARYRGARTVNLPEGGALYELPGTGGAAPAAPQDSPQAVPSPLVRGNIDLNARPKVANPDGSFSTISSMSFGSEEGEVLVPTISDDGRRLSEQEAVEQYRRTGRHLGIFKTPQEADAFARQLSERQGAHYGSGGQRGAADLMPHLIAQESGGNGNAVGPMTRWGQAMGSTQMLMGTAEEMARKLGVPWRPDLMRGDTPRALEYQQQLGQAYLQEGLEKYGGDPEKALMYYHGGPDESLWGPKTRAYASQVLGRAGLTGGQGRDEMAGGGEPGGARLLVQRPKAPKEQYRTLSEQEASDLGLPPDGIYQQGPNGQISAIRQPRNTEKPTEGAKRNVALTHRLLEANERMNDIISSGVTKPSYWKLVTEGGVARLELRNENDRRFVGAAKEWLAPILRKDTGAAVTDQEFLFYADTYIPAPGDSPAVLRQKAEARQSAMVAMVGEAGPLYTRTHGRREFRSHWGPAAKGGGSGEIRTVRTPEEARALPPGTKFRTPDGRVKVR